MNYPLQLAIAVVCWMGVFAPISALIAEVFRSKAVTLIHPWGHGGFPMQPLLQNATCWLCGAIRF
jgi:hypothetical protein